MMHIQRREDARAQKDFGTADYVREELRNSGVELIDAEQKWSPPLRMGSFPGAALQQQQNSLLSVIGALGGGGAFGALQDAPLDPAAQALQAIQQLLGASAGGAPAHAQQDQDYLAGLEAGGCTGALSAGSAVGTAVPLLGGWTGPANDPLDLLGLTRGGAVGSSAPPDAKKLKLSDASIEALINGREAVRSEAARAGSGNLDAVRAIEEDLTRHGVEVLDHQLMWRTSDGRQGMIRP
ncbi:unnamed protein product, partial [Prorocentrum cordatum]